MPPTSASDAGADTAANPSLDEFAAHAAVETTTDGITVTKDILADDYPVPVIEYELTSARDSTVAVELIDSFPGLDLDTIGFHPEHSPTALDQLNDGESAPLTLSFTQHVPADTTQTLVLGLEALPTCSVDTAYETPAIQLTSMSNDTPTDTTDATATADTDDTTADATPQDADGPPHAPDSTTDDMTSPGTSVQMGDPNTRVQTVPSDDPADDTTAADADEQQSTDTKTDAAAGIDPDTDDDADADTEAEDNESSAMNEDGDEDDPDSDRHAEDDPSEGAADAEQPDHPGYTDVSEFVETDATADDYTPPTPTAEAGPGATTLAAQLAAEIRAGEVSVDDLATLQAVFDGQIASEDAAPADDTAAVDHEDSDTTPARASVEARLAHVQQQVSTLTAYTDALEDFLDDAGTAETVTARMQTLEDNVTGATEELTALSTEVETLTEWVTDLHESVRDHEAGADTDADAAALEDLQAELEDLTTELDDLMEIVTTVDDTLASVEQELASVKADVADVDAELDDLREDVADLDEWRDRITNVMNPD